MSLIFFQGLNCYWASMINAAVFTGVDYRNVFSNLWSETDFAYDEANRLYLSRRIPNNLESMGVRMEFLDCGSREDIKENISGLPIGQWIIAGMDAFFIPWVPFYQTLHNLHYFIAKKEEKSFFSCFDPTYDKENLEITEEQLIAHVSDICRIHKSAEKPLHIELRQEAQKILDTHPETQKNLLSQIMECAHGKQKNGELLARYIDALINNRYLYLHYLQNMPLSRGEYHQYFNKEYFKKWAAVKHGLYKASMSKDNQVLIGEVCGHFEELIREERSIAKEII